MLARLERPACSARSGGAARWRRTAVVRHSAAAAGSPADRPAPVEVSSGVDGSPSRSSGDGVSGAAIGGRSGANGPGSRSSSTQAGAPADVSNLAAEAAAVPPLRPPARLPRAARRAALLLAGMAAAAAPFMLLLDTCQDAFTTVAAAGALLSTLFSRGPRCARVPGPGSLEIWTVLTILTLSAAATHLLFALWPHSSGAGALVAALVASVPLQTALHAAAAAAERPHVWPTLQQQQQQQQHNGSPTAADAAAARHISAARWLRRAADLTIFSARAALTAAVSVNATVPMFDRVLVAVGASFWLLAAVGSLRGVRALGGGRRRGTASSEDQQPVAPLGSVAALPA